MSSIKKNFGYNLLYQVFTILMPLITAPYLARIIGVTGLGMYSYTFTVAEYFVYFALLGVANYGNRSIAATSRENKSETFVNIYSVQFLVSFVVICAYIVYCLFFNTKYKLLTYIQIFYVISAGLDVTWYFFGNENFKLTTVRNMVIKIIALLMIFILVKEENDVWKYSLIMSLSYLFSQAIMWIYIVRNIKFTKPQKKEMCAHFKSMVILFIPVIAITLYKMMDKIMLEGLGSVQEVGFYESVEKIVRVPALVIAALGTSMLPRMSKLGVDGERDKMLQYFGLSVELSGLLTFGMSIGLISVASLFIPFYYGTGFEKSILLLETLSTTLIFTSWASTIRTQYLLPLKHDTEYIVSVFAGALINLLLNALLIPEWGALGAVIATISAEAVVAVVQTFAIRKEIHIMNELKKYVVFFIPGIIMFIVLKIMPQFLKSSLLTLLVDIVVGGIIYLIISVVLMHILHSGLLDILTGMTKKILRR